ncbi:hypothetical protein [Cellvibrio japonicus]|uniref:Lipoprotein n=1 Tax=Cellvibrio japonicus (strain Ueda107) TaxID=498211 RepID=B3PKP5_CELJU|nr:hypothetical protein [Cellvibrio japonicus]ACE85539.1 hypothetical protein CJA_0802 [Cellvibrio japonicus Ueda107]
MKNVMTLFILGLGAVGAQVQACSKPSDKPSFPDPQTAVSAQMVKAHNDVKAYVKAIETYLGCAGLSRSAERKEMDELKKFAESFNEIVRAYKQRSAG